MSIFDSKISAPNQFLHSANAPDLLEKAWGYLTAPFKTFALWAFGIGKQVETSFLGQDVTIHRLETQAMFDGVSCGLHSTGAILEMADLISNNFVSMGDIVSSITSKNKLDLRAERILEKPHVQTPLISPSLSIMSKKRVRSTGLCLDPQQDFYTEKNLVSNDQSLEAEADVLYSTRSSL